MTQHISDKGYKVVSLTKRDMPDKSIPVHRLVAMAFIPNPNNLPQVNHIDGNKENNNVENLEWCDNSYNQIHAYKHGLNHTSIYAGRANQPLLQFDPKIGDIKGVFISIAQAARENNIGKWIIYKTLKRKNNSIWKKITLEEYYKWKNAD